MATGTTDPLPRLLLRGGISADLLESVEAPARSVAAEGLALRSASVSAIGVPDPVGDATKSGVRADHFDPLFFDRIHVIPRSIDFGFVLSPQEYDVEVWNAYGRAARFLGVDLGSVGGLSLAGLPAFPDHWPTTRSEIYALTVTADGAPAIDDVILFDFDLGDAELAIEGTRLVVFPISPDWAQGVEEGFGYLTDVLVAYDDTEQRIQLREVPVRSLAFQAMAEGARDAALLHAVVYDWQARLYGVPWWMDIAKLDADVSIGALEIMVETTYRGFEAGGLALIWRDPATWEAFEIESVAADRIVVTSPAQRAWSATGGSWVLPLRVGRLADVISLARLSQELAAADVEFEVDAV